VNKGERISQFVREMEGGDANLAAGDIAEHPCYRGFFRCWNEQRYYEAHDVLEHLWLETNSDDSRYFKGLIQAAGGFVHLQKNFEHPAHPKHSRRLAPAVRLFRLAEENLAPFAPVRHALDVVQFLALIEKFRSAISVREPKHNPWSPDNAPQLELRSGS
jgi:hypothetical protein